MRNSRVKRAICVRAIEVLLYCIWGLLQNSFFEINIIYVLDNNKSVFLNYKNVQSNDITKPMLFFISDLPILIVLSLFLDYFVVSQNEIYDKFNRIYIAKQARITKSILWYREPSYLILCDTRKNHRTMKYRSHLPTKI